MSESIKQASNFPFLLIKHTTIAQLLQSFLINCGK